MTFWSHVREQAGAWDAFLKGCFWFSLFVTVMYHPEQLKDSKKTPCLYHVPGLQHYSKPSDKRQTVLRGYCITTIRKYQVWPNLLQLLGSIYMHLTSFWMFLDIGQKSCSFHCSNFQNLIRARQMQRRCRCRLHTSWPLRGVGLKPRPGRVCPPSFSCWKLKMLLYNIQASFVWTCFSQFNKSVSCY